MIPPTSRRAVRFVSSAVAVAAIAIDARTTTVECPREKKNPEAMGRSPRCISFRVTLSIAAM